MPNTMRLDFRSADAGGILTGAEDSVALTMQEFEHFRTEIVALRQDVIANPRNYPDGALDAINGFIPEQRAKLQAFVDGNPIPPPRGGPGDPPPDIWRVIVTARSGNLVEIDLQVSSSINTMVGDKDRVITLRDRIQASPGDYPADAVPEVNEVIADARQLIIDFLSTIPP